MSQASQSFFLRPLSWKHVLLAASSIGVVLLGVFAIVSFTGGPPDEARLIAKFEKHHVIYYRLLAMMFQDSDVREVAAWGIEKVQGPPTLHPPEGGFPLDRYNEYLALLKEIGATGVWRSRDDNQICFLTWSSGFGGDTRHVETCWVDGKPPDVVASLKDFYKTPKPRRPVYRHIQGDWYLWADW